MLEPDSRKTRQMVLDNLQQLGIDANGNVPTLRKHLAQYLEGARKAYLDKGFSSNQLNFCNEQIPKRFATDVRCMHHRETNSVSKHPERWNWPPGEL